MKLRFKKADGTSYPDWADMRLGDFLSESKIKGNTGDTAKKLTVRLWNKGVAPTNTLKSMGSENTQYYIRKVGQLIYGKQNVFRGAIGIIPKELDNYESTTDLPSFDIKDTLDSYFILLYLTREPYNRDLEIQASGTGSKRLHTDTFLNLQISLPCLEEQEKIADFFTALDEKITLIDAQLSQLNLYKQAQLQIIFSPENKENWGAMRLSDIVTIKISSVDKHVKDDEITVPVCDYMNVYNNNFITTNISQTFRIGTVTESEYDRFRLRKGDVVITKDSETPDDIGIPAYVAEDIKDLVCGYHLTILSPKELVCGKYLFFTLITKYAQTQFACYANGSTRFGLTKETYDKIMIPLPSLEEQAKIADYLSALDDKITNTQQSLEQIKSYKLAMLQKMLG